MRKGLDVEKNKLGATQKTKLKRDAAVLVLEIDMLYTLSLTHTHNTHTHTHHGRQRESCENAACRPAQVRRQQSWPRLI